MVVKKKKLNKIKLSRVKILRYGSKNQLESILVRHAAAHPWCHDVCAVCLLSRVLFFGDVVTLKGWELSKKWNKIKRKFLPQCQGNKSLLVALKNSHKKKHQRTYCLICVRAIIQHDVWPCWQKNRREKKMPPTAASSCCIYMLVFWGGVLCWRHYLQAPSSLQPPATFIETIKKESARGLNSIWRPAKNDADCVFSRRTLQPRDLVTRLCFCCCWRNRWQTSIFAIVQISTRCCSQSFSVHVATHGTWRVSADQRRLYFLGMLHTVQESID